MQRPRHQRSQRRQNQRSPGSWPFRAQGAGWMARRLWVGLQCLWTSAEEALGGRQYQPRQQVCLASHNRCIHVVPRSHQSGWNLKPGSSLKQACLRRCTGATGPGQRVMVKGNVHSSLKQTAQWDMTGSMLVIDC